MRDRFGQLVVVLRHRQATQIADDEQRVRIDRIGVEQVVLHAPDDAAERRNVAAQYAVQIHAAQLVRHADRRAQDLEEQSMIARMLTKFLVDQPQMSRELPNRRGAHAANLRVLFDDDEQFEQRRRIAIENVLVRDLQIFVANLKARIDGRRVRRSDRSGWPRETAAAAFRSAS